LSIELQSAPGSTLHSSPPQRWNKDTLVRHIVIEFFLPFPERLLILGPLARTKSARLPALISTKKPTHTTFMKDKYCSSVRIPLLTLFVTTALVLNTTAMAQPLPKHYWYNGDWNFVKGLPNERNAIVSDAAVYDDFNVTGNITVYNVYSNDLLTPDFAVSGADWEIRSGISEGNPGILIASGTTNAPLVIPTGRSGFGLTEYTVQVNGLAVTLVTGHTYWLMVRPVGNGTGRSFNSDTSGVNCMGTPCGNNDNAFFNSTYFGANFRNTETAYGQHDFSMGLICCISSARFKTNIRSMGDSSEAVLALHPVTFEYKREMDPAGAHQFGLVAEEVEKVNPDLITRDAQGKPYAVRYEAVNAMLLNEFLKEHRKVEEQKAMITQLKKDFQATIEQLSARLQEQDLKIERMNVQLELNKPASQIVLNGQ
jgi:Chaperone of endosialidase